MRLSIHKCDACGKELRDVEYVNFKGSVSIQYPDGTYSFLTPYTTGGHKLYSFCDEKCFAKWIKKQKDLPREINAAPAKPADPPYASRYS